MPSKHWFFIPVVVLSFYCAWTLGSEQDYRAFEQLWMRAMSGLNPWITAEGRFTGNSYGPLFLLFAPLHEVWRLLPKLLFVACWWGAAAELSRKAAANGADTSRLLVVALAAFLHPAFWGSTVTFGHFEIVMVYLTLLALIQWEKKNDGRAGMLLACAALLKFLPVLALPFLAWREGRVRARFVLSFLAVFLGVYLLSVALWGSAPVVGPFRFGAARSADTMSLAAFLTVALTKAGLAKVDGGILPFFRTAWMVGYVALLVVFYWKRPFAQREFAAAAIVLSVFLFPVGNLQYFTLPLWLLLYLLAADRGKLALKDGALVAFITWLAVAHVVYLLSPEAHGGRSGWMPSAGGVTSLFFLSVLVSLMAFPRPALVLALLFCFVPSNSWSAITLKSKFATGAAVYSSPEKHADGSITVGSRDGFIYRLQDGALIEKKSTGGAIHASGMAMPGGPIWIGADDGWLRIIDTGGRVQKLHIGSKVWSRPAAVGDAVVFGGFDGKVRWISGTKEIAAFQTGDEIWASPLVIGKGVVVGSLDKNLYWLEAGKEVARFPTGGWVTSSAASLGGDRIVVGSWDSNVYWLDRGKELARFTTGGAVTSSPLVLANGIVVIGSTDGKVYWLREGQLIQTVDLRSPIWASPREVQDGQIIVGTVDGTIHQISDRKIAGQFATGGPVYSSAVELSDGNFAVGSGDGNVYWLRLAGTRTK